MKKYYIEDLNNIEIAEDKVKERIEILREIINMNIDYDDKIMQIKKLIGKI